MKRLAAALLASTALPLLPARAVTLADTATPIAGTSGFVLCKAGGVAALCYTGGGKSKPIVVQLGPLNLPAATASQVGAVKPDGASIIVGAGGALSVPRVAEEYGAKDAAYGAVGNGMADDTTPLQNWVAALNAVTGQTGGIGGRGRLPCGTYKYGQTLVFNSDNANIWGMGSCTTLLYTGTGEAVLFGKPNATTTGAGGGNNSLNYLRIVRTNVDTTGVGLHLQNQSYFRGVALDLEEFNRGALIEGGTDNRLTAPKIAAGTYYTAAQPGSASIDVESFTYTPSGGSPTTVCPEATSIEGDWNLGGGTNYYIESGIRIGGCADTLLMAGMGHIGAVQNDVMIVRAAGQSIQTISIAGYLDGSGRGVYMAAPIASGSDSNGAGLYNVNIRPLQVSGQYGNAVESQDKTAVFSLRASFVTGVQGWGVYAPFAAKASVEGNTFLSVGLGSSLKAGGVQLGINQTNTDGSLAAAGAAGSGAAGSVGAAEVAMNAFHGTAACLFTANLGEGLTALNQTNDCTSGKQPATPFPGGITTSTVNATGTVTSVGLNPQTQPSAPSTTGTGRVVLATGNGSTTDQAFGTNSGGELWSNTTGPTSVYAFGSKMGGWSADRALIGSKALSTPAAPGAGFGSVFWTAGTNSGTCKLVGLAGTSTTPVTIVDNVGSGC